MSERQLPARPNLEHLKNQAKLLLREALAGDKSALSRFSHGGVTTQPKLADALHVLAREYGFDTWPALKLHVELGSEDPAEALSAAIRSNKAELVRQVLSRHPSLRQTINEPLKGYDFGTPPLLAATWNQSREVAEVLLEFGADVNVRSQWWAGSFGVLDSANPELAEYLIQRGATVDIHAAARLGKIERVRELLEADPKLVHARGGDGQLPLHFAATVEIAMLLLESGAEIDARDIDHESTAAQYMACTRQMYSWREPYRHDVVRYLLSRGAAPDILMASAIGELALVERLLNENPDAVHVTVSDRDFPKQNPHSGGTIYMYSFGNSKSPHVIAHEFGHKNVFDLLMQRSEPWLRLLQAAEIGDMSLVQQIQKTAPLAKLSERAAWRIVGVALRNNTSALKTLLQCGWPATAAMENNQTALHFASWHGNVEAVEALLQRGATVTIFEMEFGGSPLAWALHGSLNSWERDKGDYPAVVRALLATGAAIPKPKGPLEASEEVLAMLKKEGL